MDRYLKRTTKQGFQFLRRTGSPSDQQPAKRLKSDIDSDAEGEVTTTTDSVDTSLPLHQRLPSASVLCRSLKWKEIQGENLNLQYAVIFQKSVANELFQVLETEVEYYPQESTRVHVYGKWHNIPMKRVAYGDAGLAYKFSGTCIAARPWLPILQSIRQLLEDLTGHQFNFVLINRYNDGQDHIAEHRDDEKELDRSAPIASLSLGQPRDFILRHCRSRGPKAERRLEPMTVLLEHGSLLLMNPPTNTYWYHSVPVRKRLLHPRINLTFRHLIVPR